MTPPRPRHRIRARLLAWAVGAGLVTGGAAAEFPSRPAALKIGLVLPPGEPEADSILQGARAGVDWVRARSGVHVELLVRGHPGQWGTEGDDAVTLALDAGVHALIAPATGTTVHLVEQVAGRTRLPTASLCSDASVTGARLPWVVRMVPRTADEARALVIAAGNFSPPVHRWAAFVPEGRAGREAARDLDEAVRAAGGTLAAVWPVPATNPPPRPPLKSLHDVAPSGVFVWLGPREAARWVQEVRQAGFTGVLAGPGRLADAAFLKAAGPEAEGVYSTRPRRDPGTEALAERYRAQFEARFGTPPSPLAWAGAEAVWFLAQVLESAGSKPAFQCFPLEQPLPGLSGPVSFDAVGNRQVSLEVVVVRGGRWVPAP